MADHLDGVPLERLWEADAPPRLGTEIRGGALPEPLARRFEGDLLIALRRDRPAVVANFVSTFDGVVALAPGESGGGGEISGYAEPDRFMMALLRGLADVVVVGAGTVRAGRTHEWTARRLQPALADTFARWRASLGLAVQPTTMVVTASGDLDADHPGLRQPDVPVIVATTRAGADRLAAADFGPNVRVEVVGEAEVSPAAVVDLAGRGGGRLVLCEGGPHLFGELLGAGLVDEIFLTLAPQALGRRAGDRRLGLVEGTSFAKGDGRWAELRGVRRAGGHLFLRYAFDGIEADRPA